MNHQKDFHHTQTPSHDNTTPAGKNTKPDLSDNPEQAVEAGEPSIEGRSRGQVIGQGQSSQRDAQPEAPESGRHKATPEL